MKAKFIYAYFFVCLSVVLLISSILLWSRYVAVWHYEAYINGRFLDEYTLERPLHRLSLCLILFSLVHCNANILLKKYRTNKLNSYVPKIYVLLVASTIVTLVSYTTPHFEIFRLFESVLLLVCIFMVFYIDRKLNPSKYKLENMTIDDED